MAGTATEQWVWETSDRHSRHGPLTAAFAEARHLGPSLILVEQPTQVARESTSTRRSRSTAPDCRKWRPADGQPGPPVALPV